jgi:hypothetical protein
MASAQWLVSGGKLPGERVARPQPASRDDQPQSFPGFEEGRGRAEGELSLDDLPRASGWRWLQVGTGSNGREGCWSSARSEAFSQPVVMRSRPNP